MLYPPVILQRVQVGAQQSCGLPQCTQLPVLLGSQAQGKQTLTTQPQQQLPVCGKDGADKAGVELVVEKEFLPSL
jgi:hypothetical protein